MAREANPPFLSFPFLFVRPCYRRPAHNLQSVNLFGTLLACAEITEMIEGRGEDLFENVIPLPPRMFCDVLFMIK